MVMVVGGAAVALTVAVAVATIASASPLAPLRCASGYEIRGKCVPVGVSE